MGKKHTNMKFDLELRPHHILGFAEHEAYPEWYHKPDEEYIKRFREEKGDFHSDELIIRWRDIIKQLHENPDLKVRYVSGLDSICRRCDKKGFCSNERHWAHDSAQQADKNAITELPELKFGKVYDGHFLRALFKKKGWI